MALVWSSSSDTTIVVVKTCVEAIGPATLTLINILPTILARGVLCAELIYISQSKITAVIIVVLTLAPGMLQMAGNLLA